MPRRRYSGYEILVVEANPVRVWRGAAVEARALSAVVPIKIAERWRVVRREMTVGLRKRVLEDRN